MGKAYAQSTNTDLFAYDIGDAKTTNLTQGMMGYDVAPAFSHDGKKIAWLSMKRDGYEADKNDIMVMDWASKAKANLTADWDETVDGGFFWSDKDDRIYFNAAIKGTVQLFTTNVPTFITVQSKQIVAQVRKAILTLQASLLKRQPAYCFAY